MSAKKDNEPLYLIGDLLWAKIGHYPYWPCMVSYDPLDGSYYKKKIVRGVEHYIYHVQYFGKNIQHGWTLPGLVFPFEGEIQYRINRRRLARAAPTPSMKKKIEAKYFVPFTIHEDWVHATREGEEALLYEICERYASFVFKYDINFKKSKNSSQETGEKGPSKRKKKKKNKTKSNKEPIVVREIYGDGEDLCKICKKNNVDLSCLGECEEKFHKDCLGLINIPPNFKCNHCEKGIYTCFSCKKTDASAFKCRKCKYHYHDKCLRKFHCANVDKKICSFHVCVSCYNVNPRNVSSKGPFINCVRCPTTFHATLQCMPLGSVKLSPTTMICPDHFLGRKKVSPQMSLNMPYCVLCSTGGELFCCETCPNAYHISCYGEDPAAGDFFCEDCQKRQFLYAGMVLWVKTGQYRWWPAQAVSLEDLPENVRSKKHYDGEFPVQYFGTDEYFWTHRGRVIPYTESHKSLDLYRASKPCKLNECFKRSLEEAAEAFDQYSLQQKTSTLNGHSDAYKHIRVNRVIPPATFTNSNGNGKEERNCDCDKKNLTCGPDSGCLNRDMMVECPNYCNVGEKCQNQKFQKREYAKVKQFKTESCGWGLKSAQIINEGDFIIEYVGEVITHDEYKRRAAEMQEKNIPNFYFLYLDSRRMIDAGPQGNLSRFINHSCDPNCEMSKWSVNGDSRIGIFAIKDIQPGEELSFNYQCDNVEFTQRCFCGAENCQGVIGRSSEKSKVKRLKTK